MKKVDLYSRNSKRAEYQPPVWMHREGKKMYSRSIRCSILGLFIVLISCVAVNFFLPVRTNVILIGLDFTYGAKKVARSDTIILTTFVPIKPYMGILSIPRDLWVDIPGYGENRINTAHFFAEAQNPGTGPGLLAQTISNNFGIQSKYYIRIQFDGFRELIDTLGGIDISLDKPMAGYSVGTHHLNGNKALAFARNRSGSDDFFRMAQGQIVIQAVIEKLMHPPYMKKIPTVMAAFTRVTDSNLPWWLWPRMVFTLIRTGPNGIDKNILGRDMVTPYITSEGANVLLPNWPVIQELVGEMYGNSD